MEGGGGGWGWKARPAKGVAAEADVVEGGPSGDDTADGGGKEGGS